MNDVLTRERILVAMVQSLEGRSFYGSSLARILADANATTRAFYTHFGSREAVAHTIIAIQSGHSTAKVREVVGLGGPAMQVLLHTSSDLVFDIITDPIIGAGVQLLSEIGMRENVPIEIWHGWTDLNVDLLTVAIDEGAVLPVADIRGTAELLVGRIASTILRCALEHEFRALPCLILGVWQQFIDAHTADPLEWRLLAAWFFERSIPPSLSLEDACVRHREALRSSEAL